MKRSESMAGGLWSCVRKEGEMGRLRHWKKTKQNTNLEPDDGSGNTKDIPFPNFSFLFGRNLDGIICMTAMQALQYSHNASSPKPKNTKKTMEDTGVPYQNDNVRMRDCAIIKIQT